MVCSEFRGCVKDLPLAVMSICRAALRLHLYRFKTNRCPDQTRL
jgi:hypothetical protein